MNQTIITNQKPIEAENFFKKGTQAYYKRSLAIQREETKKEMDEKELQKQSENNKTAISINLPIITLNAHLIQEYIERIIHHDQVRFILRYNDGSTYEKQFDIPH